MTRSAFTKTVFATRMHPEYNNLTLIPPNALSLPPAPHRSKNSTSSKWRTPTLKQLPCKKGAPVEGVRSANKRRKISQGSNSRNLGVEASLETAPASVEGCRGDGGGNTCDPGSSLEFSNPISHTGFRPSPISATLSRILVHEDAASNVVHVHVCRSPGDGGVSSCDTARFCC